MKRAGSKRSANERIPASLIGNRNATKEKRQIVMGWLHRDSYDKPYMQIRMKRGGGSRKLHVSKDATKKELADQGTALFFENGQSLLGPLSDMEVNVDDFRMNTLDSSSTVKELYDKLKLPLLRFYLATTSLTSSQATQDDVGQNKKQRRGNTKESTITSSTSFTTSTPNSYDLSEEVAHLSPISSSIDDDFLPQGLQPFYYQDTVREVSFGPPEQLFSSEDANEVKL
jgi:hypothetical protein